MFSLLPLAARTGPPLAFCLGVLGAGVIAVIFGLGFAFDVRGMSTRQAARMRARVREARLRRGSLAEPVYPVSPETRMRMSGGFIALAGVVLCAAGFALLHLG
ncbi:hypothetical protein AB0B12_40840 [Streptomyces sp. NPDC044780]|uniref:hypothetical protein n=1 Tax=unclassified Streptomyces TaxID=2593676 RepID=UPI003411B72C